MSHRTVLMAVYVSAPGEHVRAHAMPPSGRGKIELATVRGQVAGSSFLDLASVSPEVAIVELRQFANHIEALLKKDQPNLQHLKSVAVEEPVVEESQVEEAEPVETPAEEIEKTAWEEPALMEQGTEVARVPEAAVPIPFTQKVKAFFEKRYGISIGFLVILSLSLFSHVLEEVGGGLKALAEFHRAVGAYHLLLSLAIFFLLFVLMGEARTNKETLR